jgi:hypothetical protein
MNRVGPHELPALLRKFSFRGGRVRRVRIMSAPRGEVAVEFHLLVREAAKSLGAKEQPVRVVLRLEGVAEYRMQMRPNMARVKIEEARMAHLNGLFYVSFDALGLEPTEVPKVFDFRVSEQFAAGRELFWSESRPTGEESRK